MDLEIKEYLNIDLSKSDVALPKTKTIKITVDYDCYLKFLDIQKALKLTNSSLIVYLVNLYEVVNYNHVIQIRKSIMARIKSGVNYQYILHLKILYYALGHFLKRIRVI